jgi:lysophospholipase L1-like esterase
MEHMASLLRTSAVGCLVILTLGLAVLQTSTPATAADSSPTRGLNYVALGDSFSSGIGLGASVNGAPAFCERTVDNFPHTIATDLGMTLTDATCSGATTANVIATPLKYGKEVAQPQSQKLTRYTDVVTISIGGNDLGFTDVTRSCVALSATGPLLLSSDATCKSVYVKNGDDEMQKRLDGVVVNGTSTRASGLDAAFADIRKKAPNAKVFVVGYPTIMPNASNIPADGCFASKLSGASLDTLFADDIFPFTTIDTEYLNSVESALDRVTHEAATRAGFSYVSNFAGTAAHSACAPTAERWVNAVSVDRSSTNALQLDASSLHPDKAGKNFMAKSVSTAIEKAFAANEKQGTSHPAAALLAIAAPVLLLILIVAVVLVLRRRRRLGGSPRE